MLQVVPARTGTVAVEVGALGLLRSGDHWGSPERYAMCVLTILDRDLDP